MLMRAPQDCCEINMAKVRGTRKQSHHHTEKKLPLSGFLSSIQGPIRYAFEHVGCRVEIRYAFEHG
jgi:hypothetical protein